jgi:L-asparaginase
MSSRPGVHIIFTGGTISMRVDPATGAAVPALSGEEIVARVPGLKKEARLSFEDFARLPGPHVTPEWMWTLRARVIEVLADENISGVVITHGTDTLEETAFLLHLTVASPKPIVLCGAMRTISDPGWDGPANLRAAVRTAMHRDAVGRGALVTVGEEIHSGAEATKWHTQALGAFRSSRGPIGGFDRGFVLFHRAPERGPVLAPKALVTNVDLHVMAAGTDDLLLCASLARGARGLVIEATGCGNVPPSALPGVHAALSKRVPLVLVSRCGSGRVTEAYGYEGGGQQLRKLGLIFGGDLTGPRARIKLMVALGATSDERELRLFFEGDGSRLA